MKITVVEGAGNGKWATIIAHLRDKDVPIILWEDPWGRAIEGQKTSPMERTEIQIRTSLERAGIVIRCGGVIVDILKALVDSLSNPPDPWVIGALQSGTGKVHYRASVGDFPLGWYAHWFQIPPPGFTRKEFLDLNMV